MADKREYSGEELYSVTHLSQMTGMDRRTVAKRMATADPDGKYKSHKAWTLATAGPYLWGDQGTFDGEGEGPKKPAERKAWYEAEVKRLEFQQKLGELIPVDQVREGLGRAFKAVDNALANMGDEVEREAGLSPEQHASINRQIDLARTNLVSELQDE